VLKVRNQKELKAASSDLTELAAFVVIGLSC